MSDVNPLSAILEEGTSASTSGIKDQLAETDKIKEKKNSLKIKEKGGPVKSSTKAKDKETDEPTSGWWSHTYRLSVKKQN